MEFATAGRTPPSAVARRASGCNASDAFRRRIDADAFAATVTADVLRGEYIDRDRGRIRLRDLADEWMASNTAHLKPKTRISYRNILDSRVLPAFGAMPIGRIETAAIKRWITEMTAEGLSASRIRHCYQLLAAILASAIAEQRLGRTPCIGIKLPRLPKREMRILTPAQVAALADAIEPRYAALVYTLAGTGLRWGEAAALRRGRCKLLAGQLEIAESLAELPELVFGTPKNHQRRTVAVPGFLREILAAHIAEHSGPDLADLVFTSPAGTPLRHSNARKAWLAAVSATGLDGVTPHDLRHTCASQLIAAGVPITEVAAQLGHKDPSITLRVYAHLYDRNLQAVADARDATYSTSSRSASGSG